MKIRHTPAFLLACLVTLFSSQLVYAAEVAGSVATTPFEIQFTALTSELKTNLNQLESLGGGIAPFVNRQKQIEQTFANGEQEAAVKDMTALNKSATDQLANLKALRTTKRVIARPKGLPVMPIASVNTLSVSPQTMSDLGKLMAANPGVTAGNYSKYEGDADGFLKVVAENIAARELGGLGIPCKGPFRVERFRNLQRINELRQKGTKIEGYLDYYRKTEDVAGLCKNDPSRISELSSEVRYLEQQLGLSPLTGSLKITNY